MRSGDAATPNAFAPDDLPVISGDLRTQVEWARRASHRRFTGIQLFILIVLASPFAFATVVAAQWVYANVVEPIAQAVSQPQGDAASGGGPSSDAGGAVPPLATVWGPESP